MSPICRALAPLGTVTLIAPVPEPVNGWKSSNANHAANSATTSTNSASARRSRIRRRDGRGRRRGRAGAGVSSATPGGSPCSPVATVSISGRGRASQSSSRCAAARESSLATREGSRRASAVVEALVVQDDRDPVTEPPRQALGERARLARSARCPRRAARAAARRRRARPRARSTSAASAPMPARVAARATGSSGVTTVPVGSAIATPVRALRSPGRAFATAISRRSSHDRRSRRARARRRSARGRLRRRAPASGAPTAAADAPDSACCTSSARTPRATTPGETLTTALPVVLASTTMPSPPT